MYVYNSMLNSTGDSKVEDPPSSQARSNLDSSYSSTVQDLTQQAFLPTGMRPDNTIPWQPEHHTMNSAGELPPVIINNVSIVTKGYVLCFCSSCLAPHPTTNTPPLHTRSTLHTPVLNIATPDWPSGMESRNY